MKTESQSRKVCSFTSTLRPLQMLLLGLLGLLAASSASAQGHVVIAEIYGGGGNSGATYRNDYIILFNEGATAQSLSGWSLQYTNGSGTWTKYNLPSATIAAGGYYFVQGGSSGSGGSILPISADATATSINMATGVGKLALVSNLQLLCPAFAPCLTRTSLIS